MGHSKWQRSHTLQLAGYLSAFTVSIAPAWGQITSTGLTSTTAEGFQIQVAGGIQSSDGANLFHQFENFNVQPGQTVTFVASDPIQNILGQVTGGQASIIDGGLAVSNNANLWLLNPAGILFGPDAYLNLQGDFTAATADAIGFEQGWLTDGANYQALVGAPQSLAFVSHPAQLINLGDLRVAPGQRLSLLGGSVINAGTLAAPAGTITVAAVADNSRVRLGLPDQILTLDLEPWTASILDTGITPVSLPVLLTGSRVDSANTLTLETDGTVRLIQTETIDPAAGHVAIAGAISSAGDQGGQIAVLGEQVSLLNADISADGINQGGQIYIGGNYQGRGPLLNASQTMVNPGSELSADALQQGDGGQIIVWADDVTHFSGSVSAQGGSLSGNGGFIEISGKSHLEFNGQFSLSAPQGESGTILFDPDNIRIVSDGTPAEVATESLLFPNVSAVDNDFGTLTLHANTLESWDGDDNIILQANTNIEIDLGGNNELTFQPGTGSITFMADANDNFIGSFFMSGAGDLLKTSGRDINVSGTTVTLQSIDANSATGAGDVNLTAPLLTSIEGSLTAENITVRSNELNLNGGIDSISGTTLSIEPDDPATAINIGPGTNTLFDLDLLETDILALKDGFTHIAIGRSDGMGTITLHDSVTDSGATPFQDPVTILGGDSLSGPEQVTTWTVTADNQGNLDSLFSNGLSFENIDSIVVSNGTNDILQGADGDDIATFSGVDAGTFNGINFAGIQTLRGAGGDDRFVFGNGAVISGTLDGGTGHNTLDYSAYITDITIDLATGSAPGTGGISNIQHVIAGSGANTLRGTNANDVVTLTDVDTGTINGTVFEGFETVLPGDGDDRFVVSGGMWVNLDGGLGTDTLDYSASTVGVTIDVENQTANNVVGFINIEDFQGSSETDTLLGTSGNDAIAITGNNTGTLNSSTFANIETIDARAGNDTFSLNNGASATGILIGGNGDDSFNLGGTTSIASIDGGAGSNTLIGDNVASIWSLTASNTGYGPGVDNFINIQNLIAGNQSDQINSLASDAGLTGSLDGGAGPLTFKGDHINLGTAITGTGELVIEPSSTSRDIQLGGADISSALTLSTAELANISANFTAIAIGHTEGNGTILLEDNVTLFSPVTISSPQTGGSIDTRGFNLTAPELILSAAQDITTARLTAPAGIKINSGGAVSTQDIFTNTALDGGALVIDAATKIATQQIDTTGATGMGGDVTLKSTDTIQVDTIRAEGGVAGGNVDIATDHFFQALDSFTSLDGQVVSVSTAAASGTGDITIHHGGNSSIPFQVGDGNLLGSAAGLTSGDFYIPAENSFLNSYTLGNIALLTQDVIAPPIVTPPPTIFPIPNSSSTILPSAVITPPVATNLPSVGQIRLPLLNSRHRSLDEAVTLVGTKAGNSTLFEQLESSFSDQFKSHLNLYERVSVSSVSLASATKTLENVEAFTEIKPGVLYVYFSVSDKTGEELPEANELNPEDELGLLLLTPAGETIRREVEGVTRREVMAVTEAFYTQVTNSISAPSQYLPYAQQLYTWLITPVEAELQQHNINSLALAMDTGLRTLPVAALHNGTEYLVERYSLGVIPSFSLTDFEPNKFLYGQLESSQLLAMGASQFPSQRILPAVPEELAIVTQAFNNSKVFLNERFTLGNLRSQVTQNNYGVIHLASHGVFEPGTPKNSYIQLWDQPLQLDQVHRLGLQDANIALMVLSACNTALGDREAEYGFAGLAVNAGVQTSVASLWPISDEGTLGLMSYFYQHLQQQPVRAAALRQAQLAMLQGDLRFADGTLYGTDEQVLAHFPELENHGRWNFTHPFYWSTYTLVGSPW